MISRSRWREVASIRPRLIAPTAVSLSERSRFDRLALAVRSAVPGLAVVGTAATIAALPIVAGGREAAAAEKAILFWVAICILPMGNGQPSAPLKLKGLTGLTSCVCVLIGIALLPTGALGVSSPVRLLSVLIAAGVEEIVYRQNLPHAIARGFITDSSDRLGILIGIAGAQIAFALSHFVNGSPHRATYFFQLGSAGVLLAVLRQLGGLPLAILAHTIANLAMSAHLPRF